MWDIAIKKFTVSQSNHNECIQPIWKPKNGKKTKQIFANDLTTNNVLYAVTQKTVTNVSNTKYVVSFPV